VAFFNVSPAWIEACNARWEASASLERISASFSFEGELTRRDETVGSDPAFFTATGVATASGTTDRACTRSGSGASNLQFSTFPQ
jgi:hypothetical protein